MKSEQTPRKDRHERTAERLEELPPDADADQMADRDTSADTEEDETAAGPAERNDPGNDNPATTSPVE
ncbi:hypothetical protein [Mobilicoccus caccae]|uniref:Uncharacterized protein n=1 Tax=Mobilicoccus caccae TaxID=1859295 RepID=A0ABQ6IUG0_9MICO|nr:hypothetical protein [Mobilicoccus caccae]GMA40372.1 hypothetical protein GCM10025883_24170 [Mobilicoccus caccae]